MSAHRLATGPVEGVGQSSRRTRDVVPTRKGLHRRIRQGGNNRDDSHDTQQLMNRKPCLASTTTDRPFGRRTTLRPRLVPRMVAHSALHLKRPRALRLAAPLRGDASLGPSQKLAKPLI